MKPRVLFIVGPTASGKSKIALCLARRLKGEIISADSMLVYRGMNIGTDKPSRQDRKKIPHHLFDILPPSSAFSVHDYRKQALQKIRAIVKRKRLPIIVGGSGLYIRALLQGLVHNPKPDYAFREKLEQESAEKGPTVLYERLRKRDPARAEKIHPNNLKRIIRALEILEMKPEILSQKSPKPMRLSELGFEPVVIGIARDRAELYAAIEKRVDKMFRQGLVAEVKKLSQKKFSATARQALGYKQILSFFAGHSNLKDAKDLIKKDTRHFAKRQFTWFKREQGIRWFAWGKGDNPQKIAQKISFYFQDLI